MLSTTASAEVKKRASGKKRRRPRRRIGRGMCGTMVERLEDRTLLAGLIPDLYAGDYQDVYSHLDEVPPSEMGAVAHTQPEQFVPFTLDREILETRLAAAPLELTAADAQTTFLVSIPAPDGTLQTFDVAESPVMEPELAARFPEIKTYLGQGVTDTAASLRFDMTPLGLHAQVLSSSGTYYVDPYYHMDQSVYMSYYRADLGAPPEFEELLHETDHLEAESLEEPLSGGPEAIVSRRDVRTAITTTTSYNSFFGNDVTNVLSAVTTAINRITGVYEVDTAIRLTLVNDTTRLFSGLSGPGTDNPNGIISGGNNVFTLSTNNQSFTDSRIGNSNYDLGHVFHRGGFNGVSGGGIGIVGRTGRKAQAATSGTPTSEVFYIDYVSHEMGHQFGGRHNFNNCSGSQGDSPVFANEPGSGTTIMGYAGICGSTNTQNNSDAYFNYINLNQINAYMNGPLPQGLPAPVATNNNTPVIDPLTNYTIPDQTPFRLVATGSDPDGDIVNYTWEQSNTGAGPIPLGTDPGNGPIIRSRPGTDSGERMIPPLSNVLNGTLPTGETLPRTNRNLDFTVTARDNRAGAGGVAQRSMTLTSVNSGTGFAVTAPNSSGITWAGGSTQTVTWNVSGSDAAPINTSNLRILLSPDRGVSFPYVLAESTPNDGSADVQMPFNVGTTQARIMIEAVGNIFFDISNANFTITNAPGVLGDFDGNGVLDCLDADALSTAIFADSTNLQFDVNGDGQINVDDLDHWVVSLKQTLLGDTNLDFVVDGQDFLIWNSNKFMFTSAYCSGDSNADGLVDGRDFLIWNANKFQMALTAAARPVTLPVQTAEATDFALRPEVSAQTARLASIEAGSVRATIAAQYLAPDRAFTRIANAGSTADQNEEDGVLAKRDRSMLPQVVDDFFGLVF